MLWDGAPGIFGGPDRQDCSIEIWCPRLNAPWTGEGLGPDAQERDGKVGQPLVVESVRLRRG